MANNEKETKVYRNKFVPDTALERFQKLIERKYNVTFDSYRDLHKWSVENYIKFWEEVWHFFEVISSEPYKKVLVKTGPGFLDNEWFSGAKLNYAENLLRIRDDRVALIYLDELGNEEKVTFSEMYEEVKLYAAAFRKNGLKIGDRVACSMPNRKEAVFALLAVASIGAIFGGPLPFNGPQAASNIIQTMDPKFLITIDKFQDNGMPYVILDHLPKIVSNVPTLEKVILLITDKGTTQEDVSNIRNCISLKDFLDEGRKPDGTVPDIVFEQLPFNHPLHVNFTSGTTGLPKGSIHSAGTFLCILRDKALSYDMKSGDTISLFFTSGCCEWEHVIPSLALGVTIFLNCFNTYYNHNGKNYWDILAKYNVNFTFLVSTMISKFEKMEMKPSPGTNLDCLKLIGIGGHVVKRENFEYIVNNVKKDVYIANVYGSTEGFGDFSGFNFNMPVYAEEIQIPALGLDIQCFNPEGKPVIGQRGELVICTPSPMFLIGLWKDENNCRLTDIYFSKYPGVWCQHDVCWINADRDGFIVFGRSDDTIIQNGERFGSEDIYSAICGLKDLHDYICVGQKADNRDSRAILFVKMQEGCKLTPEMRSKIEKQVQEQLYYEFVPEVILEVPDIPYNLNNKRLESVVRKIVNTNTIPEVMNIRNPDCLKHFWNIPEIVSYNHH